MRIPRRGTIAQRKGGGYVWAVYSLVMGIDESVGGTDGSFRLSSSRYKQVAKSYTVSSSGTVSLVNSTRTTAANMAVGDYLINVSTSSNTSTTGTTLYKITAISGSSTRTISYTAYTPSLCAKGEDTGERVKGANDTEHPIRGVEDGYYYELIEANGDPCVWAVYDTIYGIDESTRVDNRSSNPSNDTVINYGTGYTVNQSKQEITLTGASTCEPAKLPVGSYVCGYGRILSGKWQVASAFEDTTNNAVGKVTEVDDDYFAGSKPVRIKVDWYKLEKNSKGEYTGTYVSGSFGKYPDAGADGDYYYERLTP